MPGEKLPPDQIAAIQRTLRAFVDRYGGNQTHAAKDLGVSQGHISAVLNGSRGVGIDMVVQLAERLHMRTDAVLGLDERSEDAELEAAIAESPWPSWLVDTARSRRNLHGTMRREQWTAWMRGLSTADLSTLAAVRPSAQEVEFERRRAAAKKTMAKKGKKS